MITWEILKTKTYEDAENMFNQGIISLDQWEKYCDLWRNSCVRYSNLAADYQR